jgi:hypothetical protein
VITGVNSILAQQHQLGLQVGMSSSFVSTDHSFIWGSTEYSKQVIVGLNYSYMAKGHIALGASVQYQQRGFLWDGIDDPFTFGPTNLPLAVFSYNYISVPLKIGYYSGRKLYGFFNVGMVPSLLVSAETSRSTVISGGSVFLGYNEDLKDKVDPLDVAGMADVGVGYNFNNKARVFLSVAYQHSFTSISNTDHFPRENMSHFGWFTSLGFMFTLGKGSGMTSAPPSPSQPTN